MAMLLTISVTLFGDWGENVFWPLLVGIVAGVVVLGLGGLLAGRRKRQSAAKDITRVELTVKPPEQPKLLVVEEKSQRYRHVLALMNRGRSSTEKLTITEIARMMNVPKVGELEQVFCGDVEPDEVFSRKFADTFGINLRWLLDGKLNPYTPEGPVEAYPLDYWDYIIKTRPRYVYFVRSHDDIGETAILLEVGDWKYVRLDYTWNISGCVGGTGKAQLMSFYELVIRLRDIPLHRRKFFLGGYLLDKELFDEMLSGKVFPGSVIARRSQSSWWNELESAGELYWRPDEYEARYGRAFVEAQEIIRVELGLSGVNE